LALVGGTVYISPTQEPTRDAVVLVNDGKIVAVGTRAQVNIPQGAQIMDCSGRTVTAGFWNSHVHFLENKWADAEKFPVSELGQQL
jgi:predicted amidohydrolase YtcJ